MKKYELHDNGRFVGRYTVKEIADMFGYKSLKSIYNLMREQRKIRGRWSVEREEPDKKAVKISDEDKMRDFACQFSYEWYKTTPVVKEFLRLYRKRKWQENFAKEWRETTAFLQEKMKK